MPEGMQNNLALDNVVTQPVLAPANSPLAVPRPHSGKLLDIVLSRAVVRILLERGE